MAQGYGRGLASASEGKRRDVARKGGQSSRGHGRNRKGRRSLRRSFQEDYMGNII